MDVVDREYRKMDQFIVSQLVIWGEETSIDQIYDGKDSSLLDASLLDS